MIILKTERLTLRTFTLDDARAMETVLCDPEVMRYSEGVMTTTQVRAMLEKTVVHDYPELGFGMWAVLEKGRSDVIGYCGFSREAGRCANDEGELGYRFARSSWGHGYGFEAASFACVYGLKSIGFSRIVATIDPHNQPSVRVAERIGMCRQGEVMLSGYDYPDLFYVLSST